MSYSFDQITVAVFISCMTLDLECQCFQQMTLNNEEKIYQKITFFGLIYLVSLRRSFVTIHLILLSFTEMFFYLLIHSTKTFICVRFIISVHSFSRRLTKKQTFHSMKENKQHIYPHKRKTICCLKHYCWLIHLSAIFINLSNEQNAKEKRNKTSLPPP